ncbi:MAG TPA: PorP/SprF family type IX secretion system membrane protein [Bacteroidia bacterium]|nr:PorP/SprF family type IX secretion system membrane protein [Bacteroidia bacterium]
MKNYLFFICACFYSAVMLGQDLHFSQFNENPALVNPALTGANGMRGSINNKTQWKSVTTPYRTYGLSVEARNSTVKKKAGGNLENLPPSERVPGKYAAGLSLYRDKAGDGRLTLTQINLSLATFLKTGEKSALSFGLQTSYAVRRIDDSRFVYPNQYNPAYGYDTDFNSGEAGMTDKFRYLDLATGMMFSYDDEVRGLKDHKERRGHLGFSVYHLTQPKQKYLSKKSDALYMKYVSHGDILRSIPNSRTGVFLSYLFQMQASHMEIVAGGMFRYYLKNDTRYTGYVKRSTISGGLYYRLKDAVIVKGMFEWQEQHAIILSYDINVSKLAKSSNIRGGLEFTYRYTSGHPYLYQKLK